MESFSRPPRHGSSDCADPEASWGHRNSNLPGPEGELFFGYYLSAATMTRDEDGPAVPELTRRITLSSCHADPVRALTPVLTRMPAAGIPLGDILTDSGYAHRDAEPGPSRSAPPARSSSRTCTRRPRPPGHQRRRHHHQRQPLLPRHPANTAGTRPARTHRHPGDTPRTNADRRTRPVQARPPSPATTPTATTGSLPRRGGQNPLPAPARVDAPGPEPARNPAPRRNIPRPAAPSRPSPSHRT